MEQILNYLLNDLQQSERMAKRNATKLCKYEDIKTEFIDWIATGEFSEEGVVIEEYTAKQISELAPFMNGVGIFNFMVTLRDNPEIAKQSIDEGFPIK